MPAPTTTLLALLFLLSTIHGTAATNHVRGATAGVDPQEGERREREDSGPDLDFSRDSHESNQQQQQQQQQHRQLHRSRPSLEEHAAKGEELYASCPEGYPSFGKLGDLLTAWSPNQPEVPEGGVIEKLRVLNYSDPEQFEMAVTLRDCEVPFKIVGVPEAEAASKKWTDEYLERSMGPCPGCNVMKSESNRFMFWHKRANAEGSTWKAPTSPERMPYMSWRRWADTAESTKIGPEDVHYYLTTAGIPRDAKTPPMTGMFVADDLPFFSTKKDNFFIPDVYHQKGIQCRFGARGIIAESHFDHGKNFVLMLRGRKRYLLNPPRACPFLKIIADRAHPSFRHSEVDWSDESDWPEGFADAPALETVLETGEMLYIPSFWYHYIVSEGFNVQCNARSGLSQRQKWANETETCMGTGVQSPPSGINNQTLHHIPHKPERYDGGRSREKGRMPRGAERLGQDAGRVGERHDKSGRYGGVRSKGGEKRPPSAEMKGKENQE
ncbi:unnamed protein product [Pylaiella littoralis]